MSNLIPNIPVSSKLLPDAAIAPDSHFMGLKVVHYQSNDKDRARYDANGYEFQFAIGTHHVVPGTTIALKGSPLHYRLTATMHLTLKEFTSVVHYDPSEPPEEDYEALGMRAAHEQTQQISKAPRRKTCRISNSTSSSRFVGIGRPTCHR